MIRRKYLLSQNNCCSPQTSFSIHETTEENFQQDQQSVTSDLQYTPQKNVGQFSQEPLKTICFSCSPIKSLHLQLYGQQLSQAYTSNQCCLLPCANSQMIVTSINNLLLGKIKKSCNGYFSVNIITVQNESGNEIFQIKSSCCQFGNICPRMFRFAKPLNYLIYNNQGEQIGHIINVHNSCLSSLCTIQDDFQIFMPKVQKQKQKILLLNAVVFLNLIRHSFL